MGKGTRGAHGRLLRVWWLGVVAALALAWAVDGGNRLGRVDRALFGRALIHAQTRGWKNAPVMVSIPEADGDWDATKLAQLVARLRHLGARTIVLDDLPLSQEDPGLPLLAEQAGSIVMGFGLNPVAVPSDDELERVVVDYRPEWRIPRLSLEGLELPPRALVLGSAHVGHGIRTTDDGSYYLAVPLVSVDGHSGVIPSIALLAYLRQNDVGLGTALSGAPISGGMVFLDLRGGASPTEIPTNVVLDETKAERLRPYVDGRLVIVHHPSKADLAMFGGAIIGPDSLRLLYELRTYETGRPILASRAWALALLVLLSVAGVRRFPRVSPAIVVGVALAAAVAWTVGAMVVMSLWAVWLGVTGPVVFIVSACTWFALLSGLYVQQRLDRAEARADAAIAPTGRIALVFTDVQGSSTLWEKAPTVMRVALELHNALLRRLLEERGGYEVKTEGDAFMVAFSDPVAAVRWCVDVQRALVMVEWPPELLALADAAEVRDEFGTAIYRGLRVRMGVHLDEPEAIPDPKTGRMDYFGPPVNRAARISGAAHGGQILVGGDAWKAVEPRIVELGLVRSTRLGARALRGLAEPEELVEVLPESFRARVFPSLRTVEK